MKTLLNVGCGQRESSATILSTFRTPDWSEIRLDIDPSIEPDVLASMLDMSIVHNESIDTIYASHSIECLYPNELAVAFNEFLRVLKPQGFAVFVCPDLQAAAQMILEERILDAAYSAPIGAITPFDMIYSHRLLTGRDKPYMARHCGFTLNMLIATLKEHGFQSFAGIRSNFNLWVIAMKNLMPSDEIMELANNVFEQRKYNSEPPPEVGERRSRNSVRQFRT
jgi:hypothetical protein